MTPAWVDSETQSPLFVIFVYYCECDVLQLNFVALVKAIAAVSGLPDPLLLEIERRNDVFAQPWFQVGK